VDSAISRPNALLTAAEQARSSWASKWEKVGSGVASSQSVASSCSAASTAQHRRQGSRQRACALREALLPEGRSQFIIAPDLFDPACTCSRCPRGRSSSARLAALPSLDSHGRPLPPLYVSAACGASSIGWQDARPAAPARARRLVRDVLFAGTVSRVELWARSAGRGRLAMSPAEVTEFKQAVRGADPDMTLSAIGARARRPYSQRDRPAVRGGAVARPCAARGRGRLHARGRRARRGRSRRFGRAPGGFSDRDPAAIAAATARPAPASGERVLLLRSAFSRVAARLLEAARARWQRDDRGPGAELHPARDPARGMSFRAEFPSTCAWTRTRGDRARPDQRLGQDELAISSTSCGEEKRSRRIASCIRQACRRGELRTTLDRRRAIVRAGGPASRRGQSIRPRGSSRRCASPQRRARGARGRCWRRPRPAAPRAGVAVVVSFHSLWRTGS
jgi:hypothetical protein